ncbi:hypothetical protein SADUNF_Sadunf13G0038900 [Salix dunnii]|uniref:Uncharacterized protein n=1 Tax=Salix dunnii TaxID=1413687 RepID=A0A835JI74_9ROSI|nr:hypothetical protein SADUNF_Sadunf13G0038900 [Salix dunnii]
MEGIISVSSHRYISYAAYELACQVDVYSILPFDIKFPVNLAEMREESMISKGNSLNLLDEFELILESDPLIDEVGFIHPSQFVTLNKEASSSLEHEDANFWSRDHKLAISTDVLLPLYKATKDAFMHAISQYKRHVNLSDASGYVGNLEIEAMKHSKALLLLSCDFGTAWNFRKLIVSKKQKIMLFLDELLLSALVLSYSPKSEKAWCHRRWVIKMIAGKCSNLQDIAGKESELVEKIAELMRCPINYVMGNAPVRCGLNVISCPLVLQRSKMNYRAWNHRCWLVSYMTTEQVLHELKKSRNWAGLHVADNSCFHYRTRLMLRIMEEHCHKLENGTSDENNEIYRIWQCIYDHMRPILVSFEFLGDFDCIVIVLCKIMGRDVGDKLSFFYWTCEELDWNEALIKRYVGREALWLHRRFLSLSWIRHFTTKLGDTSLYRACKSSINGDIGIFMDNELRLANSCSTIPDDDFEDFQAQAMYSAAYILWLTKQISDSQGIELQEKPNLGNLKTVLNMACPERSFLWDVLTRITGKCGEVLKEDKC